MKLDKFDIELQGKLGKVYFIGIGGISMSGLAQILLKSGIPVVGSDKQKTPLTETLTEQGATLYYSHSAENITDDITLVVYTAAIQKDNAALLAAIQKNIPVMDRGKFLGLLMKSYQYNLLVSGAHGKTGTTAMLAHALMNGSYDPTVSIGGVVPQIGSNFRVGGETFFVAEACEYCDSFLKFFPYVAVILNIEMDHEDYFKDIRHIRQSFRQFAGKTNPNGLVVINGDIEDYEEILKDAACQVYTYGTGGKQYDFTAGNIIVDEDGCASFDCLFKGEKMARLALHTRGEHHVGNALAVFAALHFLGIPPQVIEAGINSFQGVIRRFEKKGEVNGAAIIDDYAHHPTEIAVNLAAAKKGTSQQVYCVFQPHTFSRTKALLHDFAKSLSLADHIIVTDIYASREKDPGDIHAKDIVKLLTGLGKDAVYIQGFDDIAAHLRQRLAPKDMAITMGAGNVFAVGDILLGKNL